MELKPGYKQTEVGVIPEDWEVKSLGQIMEYIKGFPFKADDYQSHGIRVLRVSDTTYDGIREGGGIYIDEKKAKSCLKWSLKEGDLIVSTVGSKPPMYSSMVGKVTFIQARDSGSLLNQNAVILRGRSSSIAIQRVLHNHFRQGRYLKYIEKIFRGNANQASITLRELLEYRIPFTPFGAEQEAIAEALSDADALIESLEQLIAKKRQIKQGAMQELLTGKNRLPGFSGEWEVKTLGEIANIKTGSINNQDKIEDGEYPFFVRSDTVERINSFSHDCEAILVPGEGGIGSIFHYINGRFNVHQRVYAITKFPENISGRFVFYYMVKNFGSVVSG